jgi:membrane protein YdbS with pleckstrin-like domain
MTTEEAAFDAKFNPLIKPFLVIKIGFVMACTVVGIPVAVIWFLGVGQWWARHYFARLECHLGERTLRYRKGILVTTEKTIPLENIQDVTFVEGPVLRHFHLSTLKFETAGHSVGQASDMHLTGIIDAQEFRNKIMAAREAMKARAAPAPTADPQAADQLAALRAIEARLAEIAGLLRERA